MKNQDKKTRAQKRRRKKQQVEKTISIAMSELAKRGIRKRFAGMTKAQISEHMRRVRVEGHRKKSFNNK